MNSHVVDQVRLLAKPFVANVTEVLSAPGVLLLVVIHMAHLEIRTGFN